MTNCSNIGKITDGSGNLYCEECWRNLGYDCASAPKCAVTGCENIGVINQHKTGKVFCTAHAWRTERYEQGLRHPPGFTDDDEDFIRSIGIRLDGDNRGEH
jgi:hypothetical protein